MAAVNIMNLVQSLFAAVLLVKAQIPVTQVRIHPSDIRYRTGLLFMHKNSDFGAIGFFLAKAFLSGNLKLGPFLLKHLDATKYKVSLPLYRRFVQKFGQKHCPQMKKDHFR